MKNLAIMKKTSAIDKGKSNSKEFLVHGSLRAKKASMFAFRLIIFYPPKAADDKNKTSPSALFPSSMAPTTMNHEP
jgi:hypothetical protein